jgi:hypothetical protein
MTTSRVRPLSEVVLGNTSIRFIQVLLRKNFFLAYPSDPGPREASELVIEHGYFMPLNPEDRYPNEEEEMVRFLRESTSLEGVSIYGRPWFDGALPINLVSRFLSAIAENSNIRNLRLGDLRDTSVESFISLLQTTTSITTMRFGHWEPHSTPSQMCERLAQAISMNRTLESVDISGYSVLDRLVISHLGSHRSLTDLTVGWDGPLDLEFMRALVMCLQSTHTLEQLKFSQGDFTTEVLSLLVESLCENQTVSYLSLSNCSYESIEPLLRFMHSGPTATWSPRLRELLIRGSQVLRPAQPTNTHIADFLSGNPASPNSPTVGSLLQTVEFEYVDSTGWDALIKGLPHAANLRKLVILFVNDVSSAHMARALRQNGSLHFVSILNNDVSDDNGSDDTYFSPKEYRLVGSYCQRNELLPSLLASDDNTGTRNVGLPTFFAAAQQAARVAPNNILVGLLSSSENVGPGNHGSKRLGRTG